MRDAAIMTRLAGMGLGVVVGAAVLAVLLAGTARFPVSHAAVRTAPTPAAISVGRITRVANLYAAATEPYLRREVSGIPARVYVPNSEDGTVDVIDPVNRLVVAHFPVGLVPHHITPSWDLKRLYVDNTSANTLTVIDPRTSLPVETIRITDPYNLYFTPDGTAAVVVAERLNRLDVYDRSSWRLLFSVPVPWPGADHLDFSADGHMLMTSAEFSGAIVKVDLTRRMVVGYAYVGGSPDMMQVWPDGLELWTSNRSGHTVSVIETTTGRVLDRIEVGESPHGLTYFPQPGLISLGHNGVYR